MPTNPKLEAARAALFDAAYAICGHDGSDFPYDIEAELDDLFGEQAWMNAWDAYCAQRDAIQMAAAA